MLKKNCLRFVVSDLEGAVEELREDVISRQCRVNMCDVEGMALMLSTVTKTFGELKGLSAAIFTTSHNQGRSSFKLLLLRVFFHYEIKKPLKKKNKLCTQIFSPKVIFVSLKRYIQLKLFFVTLVLLIALVAGFPDMQKDLKKVMAGEMEIVVNEEKSVLFFLLSSNH